MHKLKLNPEGKLLTVQSVMLETNLSRSTVMQIAKASGALFKYGRVIRIDFEKFMNFFEGGANATP